MSGGINIFISHAGKDEPYMEEFKELISSRYDSVRDSSMYESGDKHNNATSEEYIKSIIRGQIDWAGTVIVLIGDTTAEREWVDWEIDYAERNNKNIVGVYLPGADEGDVPDALDEYANAIVGWRSDSIFDAIERGRHFEDAQGNERPASGGHRSVC